MIRTESFRHAMRWLVGVCLVITHLQTANTADLEIDPALAAAESRRIAAIESASQPTLAVFGSENAQSGGSGVIISPDGYALTNFHVAQPCGKHLKCGMNDGQLHDAVIVGIDPTGDLALIKLLGRDDFPVAVFGDSDTVRVGDECFAIGNPFLLATDLNPTVSFGVVSGIRRYQPPASAGILEYTDCIQTDAAINPGNSGGPLFNLEGQLIGINGRISFSADKLTFDKRGRVNVGVGYAISIRQAMNFMGVLHSGRVVDHATLGATVATDDDRLVRVTNILDSSDAYRRGLRYGDELISLAGRDIDTANTFKNVLGILPRGWRVPMTYRRDGQMYETHVRLAGLHSPEVLWKLAEQQMPETQPQPKPTPKDGQPDGEKKPDGQLPNPLRRLRERLTKKKQKPLPSQIAQVFEARHGYTNYYFNRLNRDRVWQAFSAATESTGADGSWSITAQVNDRGTLEMTLEDDQFYARSSLSKDSHDRVMDMSQDLAAYRAPNDTGGLYVALHLWRRLLTRGPERFGEVYFWGTAPVLGRDGLHDVLVATHDVVESRFYFNPSDGQLVAMEMYPDIEVDPCELYFDDYQSIDGRLMPLSIRVRFGDRVYGTLTIDEFKRKPHQKEGV